MGKYLTKFSTEAAYTAAESTLASPNVSYVVETIDVKYKPYTPSPITPVGDVQVFADANCTQYATGSVTEVYVRINNPWVGTDSGWSGGTVGDSFKADSPTTSYPNSPYNFTLWSFFPDGDDHSVPYTAGQVVKVTNITGEPLDVTNKTKIFSKPEPLTITAKFNVTSTTNNTEILNSDILPTTSFISIEIDGVSQPVTSEYVFSTTGEHTVKYLLNGTSIINAAFRDCRSLTSIDIPSGVTSIGYNAFSQCISLTSINIPNSVTTINPSAFNSCTGMTTCTFGSGVTSIGNGIFNSCPSLTSITSHIMSAPNVIGGTFAGVGQNGTLYVPNGSSGYDTWMNDQGNLGLYGWTKVVQ